MAQRGKGGTGVNGSTTPADLLPGDLEGVPPLTAAAPAVTMLVTPLHTCVADLVSVVRIVFENHLSNSKNLESASKNSDCDFSSSTLKLLSQQRSRVLWAVTDLISSLGMPLSRLYHHRSEISRLEVASLRSSKQYEETERNNNAQLKRCEQLHKAVCRESSTLMDPPIAALTAHSDVTPITNHPASLPPLVALQDTSVKVLAMVRSLLRTVGQALLLRNPNSSPQTYQLIYTGNALSWPGIEQGTFGLVTGSKRVGKRDEASSLVEAVMSSHKTIELQNAHGDPRYNPSIDGSCVPQTPMLVVPIRGRSGGVVGALIATREQNSSPFCVEDVISCDLVSAFSSVSLYWGQGLGYIHEKLEKTMTKMESLEHSVTALGRR